MSSPWLFWRKYYIFQYKRIKNFFNNDNINSYVVDCISIDNLIISNNIEENELLKIDYE